MKYVPHMFMQGHTIDAVLRLKNRHDMKGAELQPLRDEFYKINGNGVPKAGQVYQIPVSEEEIARRKGAGIS